MKRFLNNRGVGARILLVLVLPVAVLLTLVSDVIVTDYRSFREAERISNVARLVSESAKVVHNMQAERGRTSVFLGAAESKPDLLKNLQSQYEKTDSSVSGFEAVFRGYDFASGDSELAAHCEELLENAKAIGELRSRVTDRAVSKADAVSFLTTKILDSMGAAEHASSHLSDAKLTGMMAAYLSLFHSSEALGQERANGIAAIASGRIDPVMRQKIQGFYGNQLALFSLFSVYASPEQQDLFQKTIEGSEEMKTVESLRKQFSDPEKELAFLASVTGEQWFGAWTKLMGLAQGIEEKTAEMISSYTEAEKAGALRQVFIHLGLVAAVLLATLIFVRIVSGTLTGSVMALSDSMRRLAGGDLSVQIPDVGEGHAIHDMAGALLTFKQNAERMKAMEVEQERLKLRAEEEKKEAMSRLADDFDSRTKTLLDSVIAVTDTVKQEAGRMDESSRQTLGVSTTVAAAANEAAANVQTVAAAAEELTASSREIAHQITDVAAKAKSASQKAESATESIGRLNALAGGIGEVVEAIRDIAEQTNLLALNATIESARAGEAGKGFAVVASEVKNLAMETGKKTEEIGDQVKKIQEAIRTSVAAMDDIIGNVRLIDENTTAVAGAVEEQNSATSEIGRNISEAATGTAEVTQSIVGVRSASERTGVAAAHVLESAEQMSKVVSSLQGEVRKFLEGIKGSGQQKKVA